MRYNQRNNEIYGGIKLIIRPMLASDCSAIDQGFLAQQWPSRQATLEKYLQEQSQGLRQVFVAEDGGQIAGYTTLIPHAKDGPFKNDGYPEITDLNVFQHFQRQGIGGRLLQAAEAQAKTFSSVITIGVGLHSGYGPAQRLYLKNGYLPDGSGVWFENQILAMGASCYNNDDLVLYLSKSF
jgi:GNAT superfamily N-acetyltransferase